MAVFDSTAGAAPAVSHRCCCEIHRPVNCCGKVLLGTTTACAIASTALAVIASQLSHHRRLQYPVIGVTIVVAAAGAGCLYLFKRVYCNPYVPLEE